MITTTIVFNQYYVIHICSLRFIFSLVCYYFLSCLIILFLCFYLRYWISFKIYFLCFSKFHFHFLFHHGLAIVYVFYKGLFLLISNFIYIFHFSLSYFRHVIFVIWSMQQCNLPCLHWIRLVEFSYFSTWGIFFWNRTKLWSVAINVDVYIVKLMYCCFHWLVHHCAFVLFFLYWRNFRRRL